MSATPEKREELISLVRIAVAVEVTENQREQALDRLHSLLPSVPWLDYIFWPSGFPHNPTIPEPTPEQIVDKALAFSPGVIVDPPAAVMPRSDRRSP